jgi:uncharacterized repeat protein (TIGR02543 family)
VCALYKGHLELYTCDSSGNDTGVKIETAEGYSAVTHLFIGKDVLNVFRGYDYTNLKQITFLGNSSVAINEGAFINSQSLEGIVLPENILYLQKQAFSNCPKLKNVAFMDKQISMTASQYASVFGGTHQALKVYAYPVDKDTGVVVEAPNKTVIAPIADLKAELGDNLVVLTWTGTQEATSYKVLRAESEEGPYTMLTDSITSTTTTYTDNSAVKGKEYWYRVCSMYNTSQISGWVNGPILESDVRSVQVNTARDYYYVKYYGNGNTSGSVPASGKYTLEDLNDDFADDVDVRRAPTLIKEGYVFAGWNTKQDGTGTTYQPGDTFIMGKEDVNLYAQWKEIPVTGINLNQTSMSLAVGETKSLTATVTPDNAANKEVSWKSDDTAIATVANGVVTAVADGTTTITATTKDQAKVASCVVTVSELKYPVTYSVIQQQQDANVSYGIMLVATIDNLEADEVGFVFSKTNPVPVKGEVNTSVKAMTKGYKSVKFMDSEIKVDSTKGNYIIACTVTGIPATDVDKNLYVRAFATKDSKTKYTPVYTVTAKQPN